MDVDHLSVIFNAGFLPQQDSLTRITALSADLQLFFTGYINQLCRTHFRKNTHIAYAGGDDLVIIGAWNQLIDLACQIQKDFTKFTCQNPDFHISAGLFHCQGNYPINRATEQAQYLLQELAKENIQQEPDISGKSKNRDALALFNHRLSWKDFLLLREAGELFVEALKNRKLPKTNLYKMLELHRTWRNNRKLNVARHYYTTVRTIQDALCQDLILRQHRYLAHPSYIPILIGYAALKTKNDIRGGYDEQSDNG